MRFLTRALLLLLLCLPFQAQGTNTLIPSDNLAGGGWLMEKTNGGVHPQILTDDWFVGGNSCATAALCFDESAGLLELKVAGSLITTTPHATNAGSFYIDEPSGIAGNNTATWSGSTAGFAANYECRVDAAGGITAALGCWTANKVDYGFFPSNDGTTPLLHTVELVEFDFIPIFVTAAGDGVVTTGDTTQIEFYQCYDAGSMAFEYCSSDDATGDAECAGGGGGTCEPYQSIRVEAGSYEVTMAISGLITGGDGATGFPDCIEFYLYGHDSTTNYPNDLRFTNAESGLKEITIAIAPSVQDRLSVYPQTCNGSFDEFPFDVTNVGTHLRLRNLD